MNKDKQRFTDARSLADVLGISVKAAIELAQKADAVMQIGSKTWYDWDKALEYQHAHEDNHDIEWFGKLHCGGSPSALTDVRISKDARGRLRIRFLRSCFGESGQIPGAKILIGLWKKRMYFQFGDEGFSLSTKDKGVVSAQLMPQKHMNDFVGDFDLKRDARGRLFFIELEADDGKNE